MHNILIFCPSYAFLLKAHTSATKICPDSISMLSLIRLLLQTTSENDRLFSYMTTNFRVYGHLRASSKEQDATRAKNALLHFAAISNLTVAAFFIENGSGAKLDRPELFRLLDIAQAGDVIVVEQVDRV